VGAENKTSGTSIAKIRQIYEGVREELVTSSDFASEIIREAVASAYPKHGILSKKPPMESRLNIFEGCWAGAVHTLMDYPS
jgi:hypothetical protein